MKILIVSESYWPNVDGGAIFQRQLAHGLIGLGHQVVVWAPGKKLTGYTEQDGDCLIYREGSVPIITKWYFRASYWPYQHAYKVIDAVDPDIVHVHAPTMIGWAALTAAKKRGIPTVATNHLMPENLYSPRLPHWLFAGLVGITWRLIARTMQKADFITAPSLRALQYLQQYGVTVPGKVISNGLDIKLYRPQQVSDQIKAKYHLPDKPFLMYLGRLDPEKRVDLIITAMAKIRAEVESTKLVIVGSGNNAERIQAFAASQGLKDDVIFTGRVLDDSDKVALYNACAVFTIASPAELQSIVTLEAMACEKPILAVNEGALPNLVTDGENGYLFENNNGDQLAQRAIELLKDEKLRRKMGAQSLAIIQKHHANSVTYHTYQQTYRDLVNQG